MADTIRFILNGKLREVADLSPTTTVLQYLRTVEHLTGTKEGCAEGDCGACTVIVGTLANGAIRYHTVNSCIMFLPVLDGKHLITVEYLKVLAGGSLHPVQQAWWIVTARNVVFVHRALSCRWSDCSRTHPFPRRKIFRIHLLEIYAVAPVIARSSMPQALLPARGKFTCRQMRSFFVRCNEMRC